MKDTKFTKVWGFYFVIFVFFMGFVADFFARSEFAVRRFYPTP